MAMDEQECQDIIDACRKNKVKLTIGYRLHHEPNTKTIMELARTRPYGAIERVRTVAAYSGGEGRSPDDWRMRHSMGAAPCTTWALTLLTALATPPARSPSPLPLLT